MTVTPTGRAGSGPLAACYCYWPCWRAGGLEFRAGRHPLHGFPGTTTADFAQHVRDDLIDYVGKPLARVLPLGSVLAGLPGTWTGRQIRADLAQLPAGQSATWLLPA